MQRGSGQSGVGRQQSVSRNDVSHLKVGNVVRPGLVETKGSVGRNQDSLRRLVVVELISEYGRKEDVVVDSAPSDLDADMAPFLAACDRPDEADLDRLAVGGVVVAGRTSLGRPPRSGA